MLSNGNLKISYGSIFLIKNSSNLAASSNFALTNRRMIASTAIMPVFRIKLYA